MSWHPRRAICEVSDEAAGLCLAPMPALHSCPSILRLLSELCVPGRSHAATQRGKQTRAGVLQTADDDAAGPDLQGGFGSWGRRTTFEKAPFALTLCCLPNKFMRATITQWRLPLSPKTAGTAFALQQFRTRAEDGTQTHIVLPAARKAKPSADDFL